MPRTTERSEVLALLQSTTTSLALNLTQQILDDQRGALRNELEDFWEDGNDEDAEEQLDVRRVFHDVMIATLGELEEMRMRVEGSRYFAERTVWRSLRQSRDAVLEWYFSMDEKWFKSQVSPNDWICLSEKLTLC